MSLSSAFPPKRYIICDRKNLHRVFHRAWWYRHWQMAASRHHHLDCRRHGQNGQRDRRRKTWQLNSDNRNKIPSKGLTAATREKGVLLSLLSLFQCSRSLPAAALLAKRWWAVCFRLAANVCFIFLVVRASSEIGWLSCTHIFSRYKSY